MKQSRLSINPLLALKGEVKQINWQLEPMTREYLLDVRMRIPSQHSLMGKDPEQLLRMLRSGVALHMETCIGVQTIVENNDPSDIHFAKPEDFVAMDLMVPKTPEITDTW
jgi:hypothetical protein